MRKANIPLAVAIICLSILTACGGGSKTKDKADSKSTEISMPISELLIGEWDGYNKDGIPGHMTFGDDGRFVLSQEERTISGTYKLTEFEDHTTLELIPEAKSEAIATNMEVISRDHIKLMAMGDTITFNRIQ